MDIKIKKPGYAGLFLDALCIYFIICKLSRQDVQHSKHYLESQQIAHKGSLNPFHHHRIKE